MNNQNANEIKKTLTDIDRLWEKINLIIEDVKNQIRNLPENTSICKLSDNIFTVASADLGQSWSPEYYLFKNQYQRVIDEIDRKQDPREKIMVIHRIIYTGKVDNYRFHPQVIEHLKSIY